MSTKRIRFPFIFIICALIFTLLGLISICTLGVFKDSLLSDSKIPVGELFFNISIPLLMMGIFFFFIWRSLSVFKRVPIIRRIAKIEFGKSIHSSKIHLSKKYLTSEFEMYILFLASSLFYYILFHKYFPNMVYRGTYIITSALLISELIFFSSSLISKTDFTIYDNGFSLPYRPVNYFFQQEKYGFKFNDLTVFKRGFIGSDYPDNPIVKYLLSNDQVYFSSFGLFLTGLSRIVRDTSEHKNKENHHIIFIEFLFREYKKFSNESRPDDWYIPAIKKFQKIIKNQ